MSAISRLLLPSFCLCLLAACGPLAPEDATPPLESQAFSAGNDDSHSQGTQLHGSHIPSAAYTGASVLHDGVRRAATLRIYKGELVARINLSVTGPTPSLTPCLLRGTGPERTCGFSVEGQGTCSPNTLVTLSSGECSGAPGSCTGRPILRVCSGESPCEFERTGYLGSGVGTAGPDLQCSTSSCPAVKFTCPKSGIFTVLTGPYTTTQSASVTLRSTAGRFPVTVKDLRGEQLIGARMLSSSPSGYGTVLEVKDATNAASVTIPESPGIWDATGDTFLYRLQIRPTSGSPVDLCKTGADPAVGWAWTLPLEGLFSKAGEREESTHAFTLACDPGVLAKCYRWGYKPWLDGANPGAVTKTHWACTRMARADYCGSGTSFTQDGTLIQPWDALTPNIIAPPTEGSGPSGMQFEAGWDTGGPACLSHWRWKHLQAGCVTLQPPIEDSNGHVINDCRDPHNVAGAYKCSPICDNAEEAKQLFKSLVFNKSLANEQLANPQP
ncbi:hypothetical protein HUA74_10355 [Myxococcus sp. CA051A]|uniref:ADYC domain-containing protein n=1 Tax=Myxococcus sp. CA051A TaxID=2741739 RepID=UPI00157B8A79|nr:ADYC domain-containing protein [Myxococcus sp. CA051A]NTX61063.1 hypothetical protein [Myxococcus sp. CA051A]